MGPPSLVYLSITIPHIWQPLQHLFIHLLSIFCIIQSALKELHTGLMVIAIIYELIEKMSDFKYFCFSTAVGLLVCWFVRSTSETRQVPTTSQGRQQLEEWLHQEEFIAIIARAMNQAAQNVARENNSHPINPAIPPPRRR